MAKVTHGSVQAAAPALSVSMLMHPEDTASAVVSGELDLTTAPTLTELAVCALQQGARHVLLDLTGVTFCDARGLAAFVCIANRADAAGGGLTLTGVPPRVTRLLQATGLTRRFPA